MSISSRPLKYLPILFALIILPYIAAADEIKLKCIADTNISSYSGEQKLNYGNSPRIRLKGIQMLGLFQFDTTRVSNWKINRATLFLRYAGSETNRLLRTLGISTISAPWAEGTSIAEAKSGETTFISNGKSQWDGPDTDFTDVSFSAGNTIASYADVKNLPDGWISVEVSPNVIQSMIAGLSYGMAVTDEKGQTAANNDIYSREQNGSEPYLIVDGEPVAQAVPTVSVTSVVPDTASADINNGAAKLTINPGIYTYGYKVKFYWGEAYKYINRAHIPNATPGHQQSFTLKDNTLNARSPLIVEITPVSITGIEGKKVSFTGTAAGPKAWSFIPATPPAPKQGLTTLKNHSIYVTAVADTEKVDPITGKQLTNGAAQYIFDGSVIHLNAARNEIIAFQLVLNLQPQKASVAGLTLRNGLFTDSKSLNLKPEISLYRDWYVRSKTWFAEACIPLNAPISIPTSDNKIQGQTNQAVFVDLRIPRDAAAGKYKGSFTISTPGESDLLVPVELEVNSLFIPDKLSFDVSLNTYGTLGNQFGVADSSSEYRTIERECHRIAFAHRSTLAPLGYSHSGSISTNYAPPLDGIGPSLHVSDWTKWDEQFGPYLDGSAFTNLRGLKAGLPISHFYLPFHEAWPVSINEHYSYSQKIREYPALIAEHAMNALPIEQAVDNELRDGFTAVTADYAYHFKTKGWKGTDFQFYQNDKYYYKDPKTGGRGTSWWLLDEPNHRDDWLALAFFNRLFIKGAGKSNEIKFVLREDVSRPQWQRDYLDGLIDIMCVSGELYTKGPRLKEMQREFGVRFWNYGTANPVDHSNAEAEAWAIRAWLCGADAIVPWQSIGLDKNFDIAEETALLLPGTRFDIKGPVASMRLKALRRAQQDVEYLILLAKKHNWDREQTAAALSKQLHFKTAFKRSDDEDAGSYAFDGISPTMFDALRRTIAQ